MRLSRPFGAEQRLQDQITDLSEQIGLSLFRQCADPEAGPFVFSVGRNPLGIERNEYMALLGTRVLKKLGSTRVDGLIGFDRKASVVASTDLVETEPGHSERVTKRQGLVLVFDQVAMSH